MRMSAAVVAWGLGVFPLQVWTTASGASHAGWTPFALADQGGIVVPATLNGFGPFRLLLDTGATHSSVSSEVARIVGAPVVATTTVATSTGSELQEVVRLDRFELGPISSAGLLPSVIRTTGIDPTGTIQGVVGQDILAGLRYTIDFDARRVEWEGNEARPRRASSVFALEFVHGRFIIELPQRDSTLRLVPDTGSGGLVLFLRSDRARLAMTRSEGTRELATLTGRLPVQQASVHELRIGATTWRNVPAVLVEMHRTGRSEADGLLPLHRFRRVTFDGPRGQMILEE